MPVAHFGGKRGEIMNQVDRLGKCVTRLETFEWAIQLQMTQRGVRRMSETNIVGTKNYLICSCNF